MQTLNWYLSRVARMSPSEIVHRARSAANTALLRTGLLPSHPVPPPDLAVSGASFIATAPEVDASLYAAAADRILAGRFDLFHMRDHDLGFPPEWNRDPLTGRLAPLTHGRTLDYRDERIVGNIKYLWEPSRHLEIVTLAQAWALTRDARYLDGIRKYLSSWLNQCPWPLGAHWSSSLELGIRLINWSIAWQLLGGVDSPLFADAAGRKLRDEWLSSVYRHINGIAAHLSRYSSANNHLIGEACGVWIAGITWPYWPELSRHIERCRQLLEQEMQIQNAPDGGNREQAFSYQQFVADFLLLAGLAGRATKRDFPATYWARYRAMTDFIASMLDARGNMVMIGDADDGYVTRLCPAQGFQPFLSLVATGALLFDDAALASRAGALDNKTRWLMGASSDERFLGLLRRSQAWQPRAAYPDSGYYLLGSDFGEEQELRLLVDAGPLGFLSIAAHGHADALALALNVGGHEVLVDPGTYSYHTEPDWRVYFRSTRAHNTVEVDGQDQSLQRGNFMWTSHARARCLEFQPDQGLFRGEHDGYTRLSDPVVHEREIHHIRRTAGSHEITISDKFRCKSEHRLARHWHFAETLTVHGNGDLWHTSAGSYAITIRSIEPVNCSWLLHGGNASEGGWVSRSFGRREPSPTLRWENTIQGDSVLRTVIEVSPIQNS